MPEKVPYQFQELKRAQPIPGGSLKLLFAVLTVIGSLLASAIVMYTAMESAHPGIAWLSASLSVAIWIGLLISSLWTAFSFLRFEPIWPGTWLKRYWQNNVIGNDACVHLTAKGDYCIHVLKRRSRFNSSHCKSTGENCFFVRLNLGGWFNRTPNLFSEAEDTVIGLEYWQARLKRFCFYHEILTIKVRDDDGNSLVLEAKHLLQALDHHHTKRRGQAGSIYTLFRHLLEYSEHKYLQWQEASEYADDARLMLRLAYDTFKVTIQDLDDTRRFIKSKEAQEIRESLNARFEEIYPPLPKSQAA